MPASTRLPAIVYGLGPNGFTITNASPNFPSGARKAFLEFARAVSWRPAKLEARDCTFLSLVTSVDGVVVCRLSQCPADAYGRELAMRIEGILCGSDEVLWRSFITAIAWPNEIISEPCEVVISDLVSDSNNTSVNWSAASGRPLILAPRRLINAPASWFAL